MIDNESVEISPLLMEMWGTFNPDSLTGTISVRIIVEDNPALNNLKLRVAPIQSGIRYNAPNGSIWHNQVFRDMYPTTGGLAVTLNVGDTLDNTFSFALPSPIVPDSSFLVAFVQSDQTRRILQSARIAVPALTPVGIEDGVPVPMVFSVAQNFPNPFNAQTLINFSLPKAGDVSISIYNVTGQLVETLGGHFGAGEQSVIWDAARAASGIYFYKVQAGEHSQTLKMTLLK